MFWKSLTDNEQAHVASAFVFELAKVNLNDVQAPHGRQTTECR